MYGLLLWKQIQELNLLQPGRKPPRVTLAIGAVCFLFYYYNNEMQQLLPFRIDIEASSIQPHQMISNFRRNWPRLFLAAVTHGSDTHLYYNLVSLLWKGSRLEDRFGSPAFATMCISLTAASHLISVGISYLLYHSSPILQRFSDYNTPAVGLSALLFALKVLANHSPGMEESTTEVAGFEIRNKYAAWAELLFIQLAVPNASFLGHLGGIVAGLLYLFIYHPFSSSAASASASSSLLTRFRERFNARGASRWWPILLLLAPLRYLYNRLQQNRSQMNSRFRHDRNGYQLGSRDDASASPSASPSPSDVSDNRSRHPFTGAHRRFPSPSNSLQAPSSSSSAPSNSSTEYADELALLESIGLYDRERNFRVLRATHGNVEQAIDQLLRRQ